MSNEKTTIRFANLLVQSLQYKNYNSIRKRFPSLFNINDELEDVEETSRKDLSVVSSEPKKDDPIETDTFYASGSESGDNAEVDSIRE
ncbi:hypothetical protein SNEBB_007332 [Seison nebaliae]|nr:hypothetical protein SNEBB_007332 [Seison nebaliae]